MRCCACVCVCARAASKYRLWDGGGPRRAATQGATRWGGERRTFKNIPALRPLLHCSS